MQAQTTVRADADQGGWRITRTADGVSWLLQHVGRCWRLYTGDGASVDIAGSAASEDAVIRWVRRQLRERRTPIFDVHCTGW